MFEEYVKEYVKKDVKGSIVSSILMIVVAIILLAKPITTLSVLAIAFGIIVLIDGVIHFVSYFLSAREEKLMSFELVEGILEGIAGVLILLNPESVWTVFPIVLGIWIIVKSLFRVQISINLSHVPQSKWGWLLALSIISALLGVLLIVNPFASLVTITVFSGALLLVSEIIELIQSVYLLVKLK